MTETQRRSTWRDRAPAMLRDTLTGPDGEPCFTTTDRRWLWHLENKLVVLAPIGSDLDQLRRDLTEYLRETCEHHVRVFDAENGVPAFAQCMWCSAVVFADELGEASR